MTQARLIGKNCVLEVFSKSHLPSLRTYLADREVMRHVSTLRGDALKRFLAWLQKDAHKPKHLVFSILCPKSNDAKNKTMHFAGITTLHIPTNSKRVAVSGTLLGDKRLWGKGIAYEAGVLKLDFGFETLPIDRVIASISKGNTQAEKLLVRLGYKKIQADTAGTPNSKTTQSRLHFELLRSTWLKRQPQRQKAQ
jgi:RimJ/RimL family protein N-acetyltransferase